MSGNSDAKPNATHQVLQPSKETQAKMRLLVQRLSMVS